MLEFDAADLEYIRDTLTGSSIDELEALKSRLREVKQMIYRELASRLTVVEVMTQRSSVEVFVVDSTKPTSRSRGAVVKRQCDSLGCSNIYIARKADLARGWGQCCSKSCAASHKLRQNPSHGYLTGISQLEDPEITRQRRDHEDHQSAMDAADS